MGAHRQERPMAHGLDPAGAVQRGPTVLLRYPTPRDRVEYLALRQASRRLIEPWEPAAPPAFDPFGEAWFERELRYRRGPDAERLLVCRLEDGAIVGRVWIGQIVRGPMQSCTIGYWTGLPFVGRGYMTEAVGLTLRHCFTTLRLHRVEANIQPDNEPSRRVVQRNGFRLEGYSPRYLKIRDRWRDHERWAITVEDWRAAAITSPSRTQVHSPAST